MTKGSVANALCHAATSQPSRLAFTRNLNLRLGWFFGIPHEKARLSELPSLLYLLWSWIEGKAHQSPCGKGWTRTSIKGVSRCYPFTTEALPLSYLPKLPARISAGANPSAPAVHCQ